jgi:hypothetical protein
MKDQHGNTTDAERPGPKQKDKKKKEGGHRESGPNLDPILAVEKLAGVSSGNSNCAGTQPLLF